MIYDDNHYYEKKEKETVDITADLPFDIPDTWTWVRLGNVANLQTGATFKKEQAFRNEIENSIRVLRGGNILPFQILLKTDDLFLPNNLVNKNILLEYGDIITPAVTSLENIGKLAVYKHESNNTTVGGFVYIIRPYLKNIILSDLLTCFMYSPLFSSLLKSITKKSGQAFYNINKERLSNLLIPLPPLAEQERIVEKINSLELMLEKYDELEKTLNKLESEFKDKLKKSILQYAIQGKLVKQDPNDEPVEKLLTDIKTEKEKLIKSGKIKRDKSESYIYHDDDKNFYEKTNGKIVNITSDLPFDIPDNWTWVRIKSIFTIKNGFTPLRTNISFWENGEIPWFTIDDLHQQGKFIRYTNQKISRQACSKERIVPTNSFLLCCTASIGEYCLSKIELTTNQQFNALCLKDEYKNIFFMDFLLSIGGYFKQKLINIAGTTTFPFVSTKKLGELFLPLPPLAEQHRIVDKIEELFKIIG